MSDSTPPASGGEFIAAASDGAYTLIVADFADTDTAWEAYEALEAVEDGQTVAIEGVVVVKREADGNLEIQKATDHSTKSGLKWGVVGGVALGLIFPPSIIGSAAVLGAAGAATGKIRQLHHKGQLADQLEDSIEPGRMPSSRERSTRRPPTRSRPPPRRPRTRRSPRSARHASRAVCELRSRSRPQPRYIASGEAAPGEAPLRGWCPAPARVRSVRRAAAGRPQGTAYAVPRSADGLPQLRLGRCP
jgi:uncharacterized membrane protein